jgi:hypothetical protein
MALCSLPPNGSGPSNGSSSGNGGKEKEIKDKDAKGKGSASRTGGIADSAALTTQGTKDWSVHIVGSDLLPTSIEIAERGLYPQSSLTGLPPATIRACFSKIGSPNGGQNATPETLSGLLNGTANGSANGTSNGSSNGTSNGANGNSNGNGAHMLVKPRVRSMVTFNTMNLTKPVYIGRFDCIFCMDVLPHLSRAQRIALLERLHLYLEPGGYLFLSQTEKLSLANLNFRPETFDGYTMHRKPLAASAAYGR